MAKRKSVLTPEAEAKGWLRRYLSAERRAHSAARCAKLSALATRALTATQVYRSANTVALFVTFGSEIRTEEIIRDAWRRGKTVLLPVTSKGFDNPFFAAYSPTDVLTKTAHGPLEFRDAVKPHDPRRIDLVVVPGLGFDDDGYRLGYGGGVYDRLLKRVKKAVHIGLFFDAQRVCHLPREAHDHPLHGVVTESGFRAAGATLSLRSGRQ